MLRRRMRPDADARPDPHEVTRLLSAWSAHDPTARDALMSIVYAELRKLAHGYMRRERAGHMLQTTALVNEAYLRLVDVERMEWRGRGHFFAMAATLMRRILVDHARDRARDKRGGRLEFTSLVDKAIEPASNVDVLALDEALDRLGAMDPHHAKIIELRFFGGLTIEETAEALEISPATVKRDWTWAKAWLYQQLSST